MMTYRTMGTTGAQLSSLGFGCMRLPMKDERTVDRDKAIPMLMRGYELGVNYFDTGKWYCAQDSERTLGEALKSNGQEKSIRFHEIRPGEADRRGYSPEVRDKPRPPGPGVRGFLSSLGHLVGVLPDKDRHQGRAAERVPCLKEQGLRDIFLFPSTRTPPKSPGWWIRGSSRACSASTTSSIEGARKALPTPRHAVLAWSSWGPSAEAGSTGRAT